MPMLLRDLAVGERARVTGYAPGGESYRRKLLAMGLTPGAELVVTRIAPMGDPLEIRTRGFSIDDEEHTLGMRCVAAPIFDEYGEAVAGISVSGPAVRLPDAKVDALGPVVRAAAEGVTKAMGGRHNGK